MGRAPCCDKVGLKKGAWTHEEDEILINFIQNHGHTNWRALPKQAGLLRCGKSCRLRWINYLRPDIKRGNFTKEEEDTIIQLHEMLGNRWSAIATRLQGRTDNEIKNVWHTHLKKRLPQYQNKKSTLKLRKIKHVTITKSTSTSGVSTSDQMSSYSQQSYSSATFSSNNEVSSMEMVENMNIVKKEPSLESQESHFAYYPIIDETFWSSEDAIFDDNDTTFMLEDNNIKKNQQQQSFSRWDNNFSSFYVENDQEKYKENMDFWFDVFVTAGGETKLPEFWE